ncbi:MAG: hypothetical protein ISQ23_04120 [Alphaproteobacteria bacterium]|nr:hypothetical protein [Alphaproteobacteria bacterium]MBL6776681.1 hypothetical protein [Alphaproteobacteria bacterium]
MLKNLLIIGAFLCLPFAAHSHSDSTSGASCHEGSNGGTHCHLRGE